MYLLESGDFNNKNIINLIQKGDNLYKCIKFSEDFSIHEICYLIFYDIYKGQDLDSKEINRILILLTLGDELKIPISSNFSKLLLFSLLININENNKIYIKSLDQAKILYDYSNGDYKKVYLEEDDREPDWIEINLNEFKVPELPKGFNVVFKIPISFHNFEKQKCFMLSGIDHCIMNISDNTEQIKVMRSMYIKFFKKRRLYMPLNSSIQNVENAIKNSFEFNLNLFLEILKSNGYSKICSLEKSDNCECIYHNGNLFLNKEIVNKEQLYLFSKINDVNYCLYPKIKYYIPIIFGNIIQIYY